MSKVRQEEKLTPLRTDFHLFPLSSYSLSFSLLSFLFFTCGNFPLPLLPPSFRLLPWLPYWFTRYPAVTFLWRRFPAVNRWHLPPSHNTAHLNPTKILQGFIVHANAVKVKGLLQAFWISNGVMSHCKISENCESKSVLSKHLRTTMSGQSLSPKLSLFSYQLYLTIPLLVLVTMAVSHSSKVGFNWGERVRSIKTESVWERKKQ